MRAVDPRVSYAELARWPDDGRRYELYDGEAIVVPAPNWTHQRIVLNVARILKAYERDAGGGVVIAPFDIVLSQHDVLQPDVVYFGAEKRARQHPLEAAYRTLAGRRFLADDHLTTPGRRRSLPETAAGTSSTRCSLRRDRVGRTPVPDQDVFAHDAAARTMSSGRA